MIIYNFIKYLILHLRCLHIIKKIYREENFKENLSQLFGAQFKEDWVHRLYVVFNPLLLSDVNSQILEANDTVGYNANSFIEKWVMDRMIATEQFMINKSVFDLITYKIERLQDEVYLLQIIPVTWKDFWKWSKRLMWLLLFILIAAIIALIVLSCYNII